MSVEGVAVAGLAEQLRQVLASIEAGELPAEGDQVAWLRGALAAVEVLAEPVSQLHTFETGEDR